MRRLFPLLILAALLGPRPAGGQAPASIRPAADPAEPLVTFNPDQVEVVWTNGNWQLHQHDTVFKDTLIKDFGTHQAEAYEALRVIRGLHLTQHGTVGTPQPIMEYWLSNGQAPQAPAGGLRALPIDQASLRVEAVQGQWCVRDAHRIFFNFGLQQGEALQAFAILRKYGFTRVGYLGQPRPLMLYFLTDPGELANALSPAAPQPPAPPGGGVVQAGLLQSQLLAAGIHQLAPPRTANGERVPFDPHRVEVRRFRDDWQLTYGQHVLATFANHLEAREALSVIGYYGFTEQVRIGAPTASFSFFLAHGQPPHGLKPGVFTQTFVPEAVNARQLGRTWMLYEGERPLLDMGDRPDDAQELVQVIRRYHFDALCRVGAVGPQSMTFLVRSR
jgi:hypothetical protein